MFSLIDSHTHAHTHTDTHTQHTPTHTHTHRRTHTHTDLPPLTLQASVSTRWVAVNWSSLSDERYPTLLTHYTLHISYSSYNSTTIVSPEQSSYNVTGLQPGSVLVVGVAYTSGQYESTMSQLVHLYTLEGELQPLAILHILCLHMMSLHYC